MMLAVVAVAAVSCCNDAFSHLEIFQVVSTIVDEAVAGMMGQT